MSTEDEALKAEAQRLRAQAARRKERIKRDSAQRLLRLGVDPTEVPEEPWVTKTHIRKPASTAGDRLKRLTSILKLVNFLILLPLGLLSGYRAYEGYADCWGIESLRAGFWMQSLVNSSFGALSADQAKATFGLGLFLPCEIALRCAIHYEDIIALFKWVLNISGEEEGKLAPGLPAPWMNTALTGAQRVFFVFQLLKVMFLDFALFFVLHQIAFLICSQVL